MDLTVSPGRCLGMALQPGETGRKEMGWRPSPRSGREALRCWAQAAQGA